MLLSFQGGGTVTLSMLVPVWAGQSRKRKTLHRKNSLHEQVWDLGQKNISKKSLMNFKKFILLLLHIKLRLIMAFIKIVYMNEAAFQYLCKKFLRLNIEKITKGIFISSQTRQLWDKLRIYSNPWSIGCGVLFSYNGNIVLEKQESWKLQGPCGRTHSCL